MNTPAEKPVRPIDPSADRSCETREWADPERQFSDENNDPLRSPYAPKRGHLRAGAERYPVENEHDSHGSAYRPTRAMQPTLDQHPADPDAAVPPQPALSSRPHERPPAARRDETLSDLERLAASVRRVQREQTTARTPRARPLPPVPGLPPAGEIDNGVRAPRSLEPERLVLPAEMMSSRDRLRWPLGILIAGICAAPIVYYFSAAGWTSRSTPGPQMASVASVAVVPSISKQERQPIRAQDDDSQGLAEDKISFRRNETSRTARLSEGETLATSLPGEPGVSPPPSSKAVRVLDSAEIRLLTKQGEQFATAGDFVTARVLFQRAAEAGDATAATALGATYDPTVLAKLGAVGIGADVEKARLWYQKAASLGSLDAKRRLGLLANR